VLNKTNLLKFENQNYIAQLYKKTAFNTQQRNVTRYDKQSFYPWWQLGVAAIPEHKL